MATKSVGHSFKIKDGKLVRVRPFMARKKDRDAARKADEWAKKNPRRLKGEG